MITGFCMITNNCMITGGLGELGQSPAGAAAAAT